MKTTAQKAPVKRTVKSKPKTNPEKKTRQPKPPIDGLRVLFVAGLKDIYWAEKALAKALPKMAEKATSRNLTTVITEHQAVTESQIIRLEQVFDVIRIKAAAKKCKAMEGLIAEALDIIESTEDGPVRDAGIIAASQKIEHYEIATYGTLASFAKTLGEEFAAKLLHETLKEEKAADLAFTETAYDAINFHAAVD